MHFKGTSRMTATARSRVLLALALLLPAVLIVHGCELLPAEDEPRDVRALTTSEQQIVDSDNRFGFNLFRALSSDEGSNNVFISPLSVSVALGMTLNGADGETYEAMRKTLELNGLSETQINESYRSLIELLRGLDPKVVFEIANSIWYKQGFQVEQDFLDVNKDYFDSEVQELDFNAPEAIDVINGWVDEKTHGKIEKILEEIDPNHVMFLINAIYFNGTWTYEFDEDDTQDRPFTNAAGERTDVPTMAQQAELAYFETDRFQAVDLPYGDSLFSMTVILPRGSEDLESLIADLDQETWSDWTRRFEATDVSLRLPRFKLEYEKKLNDILGAMGMDIAFDGARADFTRIRRSGGLWIDYVKHKTFVEVDEEGTEAAAVTVVAMEECAGCGSSGVSMHVDRPFLFFIREQHSGTILFAGKIVNL